MIPAHDIREPEPRSGASGDPAATPQPGAGAAAGWRPGEGPVSRARLARRIGQVSTAALGSVLLAWALTVDFPRITPGFFSDGATYYSLAHSLAHDFDFEYRREDLVRVWREYPTGPEGIFLKRGREVQGVALTWSPPFVELRTTEDRDPTRLYYGKAFIFPLFAAPFVWLFGTNGFLVLHALLMTACFACAYAFLAARSQPMAAVVFALAFLFASVAPVYMVWLTPDFFNLAMVLLGYFFWCYKEVAARGESLAGRWSRRWLLGWQSDLVAAWFLGMATFSKPTHVLLILPLLALFLLRGQWRRGVTTGAVFGAVVVGLFAANVAMTGDWNYQGGDRRTFYSGTGGFPFQTERNTFDAVGDDRATDRVPVDVLASRDAVFEVFRHNLVYFVAGRHTGFLPYFFPGVVAAALFLAARRQRRTWQWLALAGGVLSAIALILYMPYTYSGGGGPVGNRYFLGVYPVFLFVTPPLAGAAGGLVALAGGALFTAQLVTNPFHVSFRPGEHTKSGIYRLLPAELSLLNDLPVNVTPSRAKQPLGGSPPVTAYFLDDNAYGREQDAFWVRGESRAEMLLRAPIVTEVAASGDVIRPLRMPRLEVQLETGPRANRVTVATGADTQVVEIPPHDSRTIVVSMPAGLPYKPFPELPTNYVYRLSIRSHSGFIPMFDTGGRDARFLGVFVRLVPLYD